MFENNSQSVSSIKVLIKKGKLFFYFYIKKSLIYIYNFMTYSQKTNKKRVYDHIKNGRQKERR